MFRKCATEISRLENFLGFLLPYYILLLGFLDFGNDIRLRLRDSFTAGVGLRSLWNWFFFLRVIAGNGTFSLGWHKNFDDV